MKPESTSTFTSIQWLQVVSAAALPVGTGLVLSLLRPDLVAPMLEHVFGYAVVASVLLLTFAGVAVSTLGAAWVNRAAPVGQAGRGWRSVVAALVPFLLCTVPSIFLLLFGPIVFALVFGAP